MQKIGIRIRADNPLFAEKEATTLLREEPVEREDKVLLYNLEKINKDRIKRLSYSKKAWKIITSGSSQKRLLENTKNVHFNEYLGIESFKVETDTYKKHGEKIHKNRIANHILSTSESFVKVSEPNKIFDYILSDQHYLGMRIWERNKRITERRPDKLPAPHPTGIHPFISRAMINIADPKDTILDPFCGAGGLLLEASVLGFRCKGYDIDSRMVDRATKNTKEYKEYVKIEHTDAFQKQFKEKTIVTDIPYGRNSTITESSQSLLHKFVEKTIEDGVKKVCVMYPKTQDNIHIMRKVEPKSFDFYVNKSLTRRMSVYHIP